MPVDARIPFVAALAKQRETVAQRAAAILAKSESAAAAGDESLQQLVGLLAATLEELKVVEEEMLLQHEELVAAAATVERRASYHRLLFVHSPIAQLVTDGAGTIREANAAAGALLRRQPEHLVGKPLTALVPRAERAEFRTALQRLALASAVHDWRIELLRPTDTALRVVLAAQTAPALYGDRPGIVWALRAASDGAAGLAAAPSTLGEVTTQ